MCETVKAKKKTVEYKVIKGDVYRTTGFYPAHDKRQFSRPRNRRPRTVILSTHNTKASANKALKQIYKNYGYKHFAYKIIDTGKYKITKDRLFGIKLKRRKIV